MAVYSVSGLLNTKYVLDVVSALPEDMVMEKVDVVTYAAYT